MGLLHARAGAPKASVIALALMTMALPAAAQTGGTTGRTTGSGTATTTSPGLTSPPRASSSIDRVGPPIQAPSVDNNPNANRGQSMYPPRATTDQR